MTNKTPDPPTVEWLRGLLADTETTQGEAARLLHVDHVTVRRWATGERAMPWAAAELLAMLLKEKKK